MIRSWRFGNDELPVAGMGELEPFLDAYEAAGGARPDPERLRWWEAMGNVKWAVICARQAHDHLTGARPSAELASLGRRICEPEWDLLELLAGGLMQDRPTAPELLDALAAKLFAEVREWVPRERRFQILVAANVCAVVARELRAGREPPGRRRAALRRCSGELGRPRASDAAEAAAELARRIRAGELDDELPRCWPRLREHVRAQARRRAPRLRRLTPSRAEASARRLDQLDAQSSGLVLAGAAGVGLVVEAAEQRGVSSGSAQVYAFQASVRSWGSSGWPITSRIVCFAERTARCELRRICCATSSASSIRSSCGTTFVTRSHASARWASIGSAVSSICIATPTPQRVDQPHQPAVAVVEAAPGLEGAEHRPLGGDADVARERRLEPAGQRPAVDRADDRLRDPVHPAGEAVQAELDDLADPRGVAPSMIGAGAPEASLMFAKFSPDATRVGYVRGNNVYVERLDDGRVTQLTSDGSETIINGTSDWVYEEEFGVRDGFRWSPDGRSIAYWQFDSAGVGIFSLINNTDALYPVITKIPYPKAGTTNSAARIGVVSADGGETTWLKTEGDPRNTYLARIGWIDANTVAIQQLNRLQNHNDFLSADVKSGAVKRIFRDESKQWVDINEEVPWIDGGRTFLWQSEKNGWNQVYRVPREGGNGPGDHQVRRLTSPTFPVSTKRAAGCTSAPRPTTPAQRYLYRSRLDGSGAPERVTPADQPGTHLYDVSPNGRLAFHTYSRFDAPPITEVIELPSHKPVRPLTDTSAVAAKVKPLLNPPAEFFRVDIGDGVMLDGYMLKPSTFDATKKYPLITFVYGEPASQTVTDSWGGSRMLFHRALVETGYIVLSIDNRGTPAPRGTEWRKVVYGTVGDLSSKDQAAAVRALDGEVSVSSIAIASACGDGAAAAPTR